jgi:signal transduction histidine kinase
MAAVVAIPFQRLIAGLALLAAAASGQPQSEMLSLDAKLAQTQREVMSVTPAPALLERIPDVVDLSRSFEAAGAPAKAGAALNYAVIYSLMGGDLGQAIALADRAAELCTAARDRRCFGNAMNQSAIGLLRLNDPYAAMQRLKLGSKAFVEAGDTERAAIARLNSANIRYDIGDFAGALADYELIDRDYGTDPDWDAVGMLTSKAQVLVKLGRLDDARAAARRAAAMLQDRGRSKGTRWESDVAINTRATMALVEASLGNADAALPLYEQNLAAARRSQSPLERYNANFAFAEGLMALGRPAAAYPYIKQAIALVDESDPAGRRDTFDLASRISADVGNTTEALAHLRAAEAIRNELSAATLRSAVADANAQTAVAEREAQLARRDAEWAAQRARWLGWSAFGVIALVLLGVTLVIRFRAQALEQRFSAVLEERTRMARELHDTLLQGFTGITMQLRAASKSDPARVNSVLGAMADEAGRWVSETRHAVWDMRAATAAGDLRKGLEQAIATARTQSTANITLACEMQAEPDATATGALLRVAQEALSNAARHADASQIDVSAEVTPQHALLAVRDNGIGFKAAPELSALGGHWGLLGMRERIEALGGTFSIDSAPGRGATVTAELPL